MVLHGWLLLFELEHPVIKAMLYSPGLCFFDLFVVCFMRFDIFFCLVVLSSPDRVCFVVLTCMLCGGVKSVLLAALWVYEYFVY